MVAHAAALERWHASGRGEHVGDARPGPERADVVSGAFALRTGQAVAGDRGVHELRVARRELLGVEAEARERREPNVGDEHVGVVDEPHCDRVTRGHREVDDDAALAPVVELERRVEWKVTAEHPGELPGRVTGARLDLDHVCAPVGEDAPGSGTRHPHPQLDDPDAIQRTHVDPPQPAAPSRNSRKPVGAWGP